MTLTTAGSRRCRRLAAVAMTSLALPAFGLAADQANAASGDCSGTLEVTCTFGYTGGAQWWTPPAGLTQATFTLYGAQGGTAYGPGGGAGGLGAKVVGTLNFRTPQTYQINVGQGGETMGNSAFGGGGIAPTYFFNSNIGGAGGGGASDVRGGAYLLNSRLLVAGGGGGGGNHGTNVGTNTRAGGRGGDAGSAGGTGVDYDWYGTLTGGTGGTAGTMSAGGSGGAAGGIVGQPCNHNSQYSSVPGADGGPGVGGGGNAGGGGGGGYYGGGSGGAGIVSISCGNYSGSGGGGGGSSFPASAAITNGVPSPDGSAHGQAIITYTRSASTTSLSATVAPAVTAQPFTYLATVAPAGARGTVAFTDGGTPISGCAAQLVGPDGVAKCTVNYGERGTHTIQATYSGSGALAPSSAVMKQLVLTGTTTKVSTASNTVPVGTPVAFVAKVFPSPTAGTVSFFIAGSATPVCAAVSLEPMIGVAHCNITFPAAGVKGVRASYSGSPLFAASDSPSLPVQVQ